MKASLSDLPCFKQVEKVSAITSGLSQSCFKVNADNKVYFAKTITNPIETQVALSAAKQTFSPAVYYHDQHWLITTFIDSNNLANTRVHIDTKITDTIKLMTKCHQLKTKPTKLDPEKTTLQLINNGHYSVQKKTELLRLRESILPLLNHNKNLVCCHGDLNFSNVLINQEQNTWLVDYECACVAPVEYDLAMLIAVNNIAEDKVPVVIEQYEQQSHSMNIDIKLLNNYLAFSYFINSLWYSHAYQDSKDIKFLNLHQQQLNSCTTKAI